MVALTIPAKVSGLAERVDVTQEEMDQMFEVPGDDKPEYEFTHDHMVRVYYGMHKDAAGPPPFIDLYDERGQRIGGDWKKKNTDSIKEGKFMDYIIKPTISDSKRWAAYIRLTAAGNDGVCISGISIVHPGGESKALILADVLHKTCELPGFMSVQPAKGNDDEKLSSSCIWLDRNNSYRFIPMSVSFHITDFSGQSLQTLQAYPNSTDLLCKSAPRMNALYPKKHTKPRKDFPIPIFYPPLKYGDYNDSIRNYMDPELVLDSEQPNGWPASFMDDASMPNADADVQSLPRFDGERLSLKNTLPGDVDGLSKDERKKLRVEHHQRFFGDQFVASDKTDKDSSADTVCANEWSWGPHFANTYEEKFCNVADLTVWPFCQWWDLDEKYSQDGCFNFTAGKLHLPNKSTAPNGALLGALVAAASVATPSVLSLALSGWQT